MLGAVRVAQGWEREQSFGQVLQDGIEARLGWGFVALGRKMGFGWAHPAPGGMGNLPFAPLLCQGPKMGRRGVKSGERGEIWREGEAGRSKAQAMGSDNLNSCAEGLSLQAN